jgi:hypothetical protein
MTGNVLWSTLDAFQVDLSSRGAAEAIGRLVSSLARHRLRMAPTEWQASCAAVGEHPAMPQLLEDPYSRDARTKPAGYAGDARTLDYVYLQNPGPQAVTTRGRALFDESTGIAIAAAVRDRRDALADAIVRRAAQQAVSVASIACGHARELERLPTGTRDRVRFWGIDQDARSIAYCRSQHDPTQATFEVGSVRDLIAGRLRIPPSDLIYASGLFDYLEQRVAVVLLKRMLASLNPGGSLIVPNLTPENAEIGYMEAIMDWWMCYRTEADMLRLANLAAGQEFRPTTFLRSGNLTAWLQIDRGQPSPFGR